MILVDSQFNFVLHPMDNLLHNPFLFFRFKGSFCIAQAGNTTPPAASFKKN
jgi:hypothetical protein